MSATLSRIEKRTAYTLLLPAVCLVFAIILFPIFANIWISFKEVGLKDIRIPEPRAKKIVKNIQDSNSELKIIYKLRNSSLIQDIREVRFSDKLPKNIDPVNLDKRCEFKSQKVKCFFGDWEAGYRENFEIFVKDVNNNTINSKDISINDFFTKLIFRNRAAGSMNIVIAIKLNVKSPVLFKICNISVAQEKLYAQIFHGKPVKILARK